MRFTRPSEYLGIVRQLIDMVNRGELLLAHATCPLQDLFNAEWPGHVVEHGFLCTTCCRSYQLFADTFYGRARWEQIGGRNQTPVFIDRPAR